MCVLRVKVVPGSSRTNVVGWLGDSLKVRVTAKPEKGRANEAVVALLAEILRIPKKNVSIASGTSSPQKMCKIKGLTENQIQSRLPRREP